MFFGKRFSGYREGPLSGLDILVLSIIKNHEGISGYKIIQEINEKFKSLWRASPGTIYPLLNRLYSKRFVETEDIIDKNNRHKKIYTSTDSGIDRLKEVLKDNLEISMNTLGDFIRTIVRAWVPNEERINKVMTCFPFHCSPYVREIDENDYTQSNIDRINKRLADLEFSKKRLSNRLEDIENQIKNYKELKEKLEIRREKETRVIPILDDEEFYST